MSHVGKRLNLAPHRVGDVDIYGPGDIEGHLGSNKRFYVVDFGRCMPPEAPLMFPNSIFYNLLRPNFVKNYRVPLCSDAFSKWMTHEPKARQLNKDVEDATMYLYENVIPEFAKWLDENHEKQPFEHLDELIHETHRRGINIRHLGRLRSLVKDKNLRKIILTECVARTIKNLVRYQLRLQMSELKVSVEEPYLNVIYRFIEPIFFEAYQLPSILLLDNDLEYTNDRRNGCKFMGEDVNNFGIATTNRMVTTKVSEFYFEVKLEQGSELAFGISFSSNNNKLSSSQSESSSSTTSTDFWQISVSHLGIFQNGKQENKGKIDFQPGSTFGLLWTNSNQITIIKDKKIVQSIELVLNDVNSQQGWYPVFAVGDKTQIIVNFGSSPFDYDPFQTTLVSSSIQRRLLHLKSLKFWTKEVKIETDQRFPGSIPQRRLSENDRSDLRFKIDMSLLLKRFEELSSIKLSKRVFDAFQPFGVSNNNSSSSSNADESTKKNNFATLDGNNEFMMAKSDVISIGSKVNHMGLIDLSESAALLFEVENYSLGTQRMIQLLTIAREKIKLAMHQSITDSEIVYYFWGKIAIKLASTYEDLDQMDEYKKYVLEATSKFKTVIAMQDKLKSDNEYLGKSYFELATLAFKLAEFPDDSKYEQQATEEKSKDASEKEREKEKLPEKAPKPPQLPQPEVVIVVEKTPPTPPKSASTFFSTYFGKKSEESRRRASESNILIKSPTEKEQSPPAVVPEAQVTPSSPVSTPPTPPAPVKYVNNNEENPYFKESLNYFIMSYKCLGSTFSSLFCEFIARLKKRLSVLVNQQLFLAKEAKYSSLASKFSRKLAQSLSMLTDISINIFPIRSLKEKDESSIVGTQKLTQLSSSSSSSYDINTKLVSLRSLVSLLIHSISINTNNKISTWPSDTVYIFEKCSQIIQEIFSECSPTSSKKHRSSNIKKRDVKKRTNRKNSTAIILPDASSSPSSSIVSSESSLPSLPEPSKKQDSDKKKIDDNYDNEDENENEDDDEVGIVNYVPITEAENYANDGSSSSSNSLSVSDGLYANSSFESSYAWAEANMNSNNVKQSLDSSDVSQLDEKIEDLQNKQSVLNLSSPTISTSHPIVSFLEDFFSKPIHAKEVACIIELCVRVPSFQLLFEKYLNSKPNIMVTGKANILRTLNQSFHMKSKRSTTYFSNLIKNLNLYSLRASPQSHKCKFCQNYMFNPVKISCGHYYCHRCIVSKIVRESIFCPKCKKKIKLEQMLSESSSSSESFRIDESYLDQLKHMNPSMYKTRNQQLKLLEISDKEKIKINLCFGNKAKLEKKDAKGYTFYNWTFYVKTSDGKTPNYIEKVFVQLHPTFFPNELWVKSDPFEISRLGWGTFTISFRVYFHASLDTKPLQREWELNFDEEESEKRIAYEFLRKGIKDLSK
eukprot:TRINITY_DN989_c3_g1_i4.p1 TRINITY_DN989_c3_g1~~TRINITY_DN989_c3_g1_i4.p1  ORF type:complete len:1653 (+),score=390.20 TRINITY_DN989_c3_g1_i4:723-4961(+)